MKSRIGKKFSLLRGNIISTTEAELQNMEGKILLMRGKQQLATVGLMEENKYRKGERKLSTVGMENFLSLQLILPRTHRTLVRAFNLSQLRKLERRRRSRVLFIFASTLSFPQGGERWW
jgi:hypothetical protein